MAECLLRRSGAFHDVRSPPISAPIPMRKQLTGEPVAGELHTGFGGRGRRQPFPTPIHRPAPAGRRWLLCGSRLSIDRTAFRTYREWSKYYAPRFASRYSRTSRSVGPTKCWTSAKTTTLPTNIFLGFNPPNSDHPNSRLAKKIAATPKAMPTQNRFWLKVRFVNGMDSR
jgi:hypothetical protein